VRLLYVTWDGPENNYLDALFFPIFERLRRVGVQTHVVQFSWDLESFRERTATSAAHYGVTWEVHAVPRRPLHLATAAAVSLGAVVVARSARKHRADVLMPRSHIPAAIALTANRLVGRARLVWDSDGLVPDERAEFGGWSRRGPVYLGFRALERHMVRRSATVLTRTTHAAEILAGRAGLAPDRFVVVSNGKDPDHFSPGTPEQREAVRAELGVPAGAPLVAHVGSLGPQYRCPEMLQTFLRIRQRLPGAFLLLLTSATDVARRLVRDAGLPDGSVAVLQVPASDVPRYVRACDAGFAFREPSLSQRAVCPIKVAEYLLCGVPVLSNRGVGDLERQLTDSTVGLLAADLSPKSLDELTERFVSSVWPQRESARARARALGLEHYSLDACANGYARALGLAVGSGDRKGG
jgi:glycosyltransferase involved in cell wall biosynthesis